MSAASVFHKIMNDVRWISSNFVLQIRPKHSISYKLGRSKDADFTDQLRLFRERPLSSYPW